MKFTASKLILWVEGYPSPQHPPTKPTRPKPDAFVPTYSLCSGPKTQRGEHEKLPWRDECENLLEGKIGPSISLSPFLCLSPACLLLTKAADSLVEINSMEPTDESMEEKRAEKDREVL